MDRELSDWLGGKLIRRFIGWFIVILEGFVRWLIGLDLLGITMNP